MSAIRDLTAKLCPNGVAFVTVGDAASLYGGLTGKTKNDFGHGSAAFVPYTNVFSNPAVDLKATAPVDVSPGERQRPIRRGDVLFTGSSENLAEVAMSSVVTEEPHSDTYLNSFCFGLRWREPLLDPLFAKHLFRSAEVRQQLVQTASGVTRFNVSKALIKKCRIPVPPHAVQLEIASTLETMKRLEAELATELEAELKARRQQYEHYREVMIRTIGEDRVALADLGSWSGGVTPSKTERRFWSGGTIPWLASMDVSQETSNDIRGRVTQAALEETSLKLLPAPTVAVVMRSNILRRSLPVGLVEVATTVNQDIRALVPRNGVSAGYVYQVLKADRERIRRECVRTDGSMAAVDRSKLMAWEVPLPSLAEQMRIASELSRFDAITNDLSAGLSAEIAARRKQYEYHRDLLLTFPEKTR